ncbi:MAG: cupin domain-containing protein [Rubrobacter sp.]|nr:cupin domain-containing protein [Rubrobacter sp.]
MANAGDIIENPLTGERITFLDRNRERMRIRVELPAGAAGPPMHYHLAFTETFEAVEGSLDLLLVGGKKNRLTLKSGESAHVPVKVPHTFSNGSDEPVVFECEISPAREWEKSIRTAFGLARDGRTNKAGVPKNIWELALLYELSESYMTGMPLFLQRGVFGMLAGIARRKGYDPEFSRYARSGSTMNLADDRREERRKHVIAHAGEVIENPLSGERITFLEVPSEANGDLLRFDWDIPPGFSIPEHVHPRQVERHEIISGTLRGRVGGRERDYGEGERVIGPADVPHAWRNPSDDEGLRIVSELQPALGFEKLLVDGFAIAGDLKTDKPGIPGHVLRIAILLDEAGREFYFIGVPLPVWNAFRTLVAALSRVGRMLGYETRSPEHRPSNDRRKAVAFLAVGLAGTALFAWLRRRDGSHRRTFAR